MYFSYQNIKSEAVLDVKYEKDKNLLKKIKDSIINTENLIEKLINRIEKTYDFYE